MITKNIQFKFGELVENGYTSKNNPIRYGYFVRYGYNSAFINKGEYAEFTDKKGKFWKISKDCYDKLKIIKK